jgi:hypothetical protein
MELRSWPKKWNDAARRRISALPDNSPSRPWPLLGMLALGLVAGAAIGGYAVSQRSQMRRLATYAHRIGDELAAMGGRERSASPPQIQA